MNHSAVKYLPRLAVLLLMGATMNVVMAGEFAIWSDRAVRLEDGVISRFGAMGGWAADIFTGTDQQFLSDASVTSAVNACMYRHMFGFDRRIFVPESPGLHNRVLLPPPGL